MSGRTRPRLFSFSRDVELAHYDELVRSGEARAALEAAIDAFLEICADRRLTPERLAPIARAAAGPDLHVRLAAMNRLAVLTHYFDEAAEALAALADHAEEDVRLLACATVGNVPPRVAGPLLVRYLADPAWRVRKCAAQVFGAIAVPGSSPDLEDALSRERDARVRIVLQLAVGFQEEHAHSAL